MMKVKLKALLKSDQSHFDFYENNQFIVRIGNNLCIKELDRKQYQFVPLSKNLNQLYTFKVSPGNRAIFTFEKTQNVLQVCSYSLKGQKKAIRVNESNSFLPVEVIEHIQLLTQQYDSTMLYGVACTNSQACLFLADFNKMKIIAIGYINLFEDIKVNFKESLTLSICGKGFVKLLKANAGHWETEDKLPKKLSNEQICKHFWINAGRLLITTKTFLYLIQDSEIVQTIDLQCSQVNHLLLLPSGLFLIVDNNRIKLFKQDPEESSFMSRGQLVISEQKIQRAIMNSSEDTVLFRGSSLQFYTWKTDNLNENDLQQRFSYQKLESLHQKSKLGNISLSANKNILLIIEKNLATLWDLNKNCPTISQQFVNFSEPDSKIVNFGAINPDALSFVLAFPDKIRFYRILLSKFKQYAEVAVKKCQQIVYSHGGQLVACICSARTNSIITIYNTVRIRQVLTIKLNAQPTHLVWNEHDDEVILSSNKNTISCYKISDKSRCWQIQLEQKVNFLRFDYNLQKLLVSTDNWIYCVNGDKQYEKIPTKIENFDYVFPVQGIYLMADKQGCLYSTNSLESTNINQYKLFTKKKFKTMFKKDILICWSDLSEVVMLDCSKGLEKNQYEDELILIEKQEVTKFFQKIKTIQSDFNNLQTFMSVKLQEQRKKYGDALEQNTQKFKQQISFMQNKLNSMQKGRISQQKENGRLFQIVETGQKKDIKQLEDEYHKKLMRQRQKFFSLQQQTLQQKMTHDRIFQELEMKYNGDISTIRGEYQSKLQLQFQKIQKVKTQSIKDRKQLQARIINLWEQSAEALESLQLKKDSKIEELLTQKNMLQRNYDAQIVKQRNLQDQFQNLQGTCQKLTEQIDSYKKKIEEYVNRVRLLQNEINKKNVMVEQRNSLIEQQSEQISGLEKAKYVLSFRTSQIRKELQPKQASIDKLKSQLFKLDNEYKKQIKTNFELNQRLQKITKVADISKQQCTKYKSQLKIKQKDFDEICSQIFNVVNYIDPSNWNNEFVKIYRNYVKEENHNRARNNKEDKTAEQINRQLIHVEQSLLQASIGNEKSLKARNMDLIRKMKENADLLKQLNEVRKELKQERQKTQRQTDQIRKLQRINHEFNKSTRNVTTANTRRQVASRDYRNADISNTEISFKRTSEYLLPSQQSRKSNRVLSAHKTMMWRDDINNKKQKTKMITDLAKQLETAKNTIRRQDRMIQQLNQRLLGLPQEMLQ